jgi:hypothetical protein
MAEVRDEGLRAARHLDGDIWEVRVMAIASSTGSCSPRRERGAAWSSRWRPSRRTQKTPPAAITLAKRRLTDGGAEATRCGRLSASVEVADNPW